MKDSLKNSRREFIKKTALTAAGTLTFLSVNWQRSFAKNYFTDDYFIPADEGFKLPPLPYSFDALEPFIDTRTLEIHYTKHHQAYIDKLNGSISVKSKLGKGTVFTLELPNEKISKYASQLPIHI